MIRYDDDRARLDVARVHRWLAGSYWSPGIARDTVERARGRGVGRGLVGWFLDHPDFAGIRRVALVTLDAYGAYADPGFTPLRRPANFMERLDPDYLARLEAM